MDLLFPNASARWECDLVRREWAWRTRKSRTERRECEKKMWPASSQYFQYFKWDEAAMWALIIYSSNKHQKGPRSSLVLTFALALPWSAATVFPLKGSIFKIIRCFCILKKRLHGKSHVIIGCQLFSEDHNYLNLWQLGARSEK